MAVLAEVRPYIGYIQTRIQLAYKISSLLQSYMYFYFTEFSVDVALAGKILIGINIVTLFFGVAPQIIATLKRTIQVTIHKYKMYIYKVDRRNKEIASRKNQLVVN